MNDQRPTQSFDESVAQVMQTLPPPIRHYLGQGKYSIVANNLMTKYSLHIDQGGILEREIMLLLMGVENPDEFVQALADEAKLDQKTISGIVQDINTQIFVPLREEMRHAGGTAGAGKPAQSAVTPIVQSSPPAPALPVPPLPLPQPRPASSIAQLPPKAVMPQSLGDAVRAAVAPAANTLLEDHEEPHIEAAKPTLQTPSAPAPRVVPPPPPVPRAAPPPPANLPGVLPEQKPIIKSYGADPYREPIDDADGRKQEQ